MLYEVITQRGPGRDEDVHVDRLGAEPVVGAAEEDPAAVKEDRRREDPLRDVENVFDALRHAGEEPGVLGDRNNFV